MPLNFDRGIEVSFNHAFWFVVSIPGLIIWNYDDLCEYRLTSYTFSVYLSLKLDQREKELDNV